jgi:hypothetical protein
MLTNGRTLFLGAPVCRYLELTGEQEPINLGRARLHSSTKAPFYQEINLSSWLAGNPASVIETNFGISHELVDQLPKKLVGFAARA